MIKALVRRMLGLFGVLLIRRESHAYVPGDEAYQIVARLVGRPDPVVIDGGAHKGSAVVELSRLLAQAQFHCFEPDPILGAELRAAFANRPDVHVVGSALGRTAGKALLNINASRPTNSLLPSSTDLNPDLKDLCRTVQQVEVDVTTIDAYCQAQGVGRVDILKLDLQGYDYQALQGASATLRGTRVVLVEVLFREIYQGCGLFPEILGLLQDCGFDLYTLCGLQYGSRSELMWADAIFVRRDRR